MSKFWKLWGSIAGGVAGLLVAGAASAGLATCADASQVGTCTIAGFTVQQITTGLIYVGSIVGTYLAPPNAQA